MRNTLTISLSPAMLEFIKKEVVKRDFANVSEFFRCLVRAYQEETLLRQQLMQNQRAVARGQVRYGGGTHALKNDEHEFEK
ncbi:MAG: ribbon-helix-helix domain-containing protein [Candidatus Peregrinibacteria bacterium]